MKRTIYKAKYLPATNYLASRIRLTNLNTNESKIYPRDYAFFDIYGQATDIIENKLTYLKVVDLFLDGGNCYLIAKSI